MLTSASTFMSAVETVIESSYSAGVDPQVKKLALQQMTETRQSVVYGDFLACDSFDVMERLDKIQVPTLLICGSVDRMTPPNRSEFLRDHIEGAQLNILDGAGHMVATERPDEVAGLLSSFLEQIPS
jgi:pimeloyl-ACP methyl ester carboxylesterase